MSARVQPGRVHACGPRSHVSPLLTLLHAPRFHPKQRCSPASFVARPERRAVGTDHKDHLCDFPSHAIQCMAVHHASRKPQFRVHGRDCGHTKILKKA